LTARASGGSKFGMVGLKVSAPSPWSLGAAVVILMTTAACVNESSIYSSRDRGPGVLPPPAHFVQESAPLQCVPYARERSGIQISGDASEWWRLAGEKGYERTRVPEAGAVIVLAVSDDGSRGHVAYVDAVISSREIIVDHANWHGHGEVAVDVPVIDVSPNNDWSEVHVLWVETGQMGSKTYPVEGFVLPQRGYGA
jgi:hypothetical protein